jgi:hypothetical protein
MTEPDKKLEEHNAQSLKTFDMYSCFSRWDVLLAIAVVVGLLLLTVYFFLQPQPV